MWIRLLRSERTSSKKRRLPRSTVDAEALDVYHDAEERLNHSDNEHRDIIAAFPEQPSQYSNDGSGYDENQEEAADVVPESDIGAADRSRSKKMSEESDHE